MQWSKNEKQWCIIYFYGIPFSTADLEVEAQKSTILISEESISSINKYGCHKYRLSVVEKHYYVLINHIGHCIRREFIHIAFTILFFHYFGYYFQIPYWLTHSKTPLVLFLKRQQYLINLTIQYLMSVIVKCN